MEPWLAMQPDDDLPLLLVADDDRNMRRMLEKLFCDTFRVITASDGAETLQAIESHHPDVLLIDLILPDTSGIDLIGPIHERDPHLPVILLTGMAKKSSADEAMMRGAYDYVLKPIDDYEGLEAMLKRAVAERRGVQ